MPRALNRSLLRAREPSAPAERAGSYVGARKRRERPIAAPLRAPGRDASFDPTSSLAALLDLVALHAFAWLFAGCAVGLLLAILLLVPALGDVIAPFSYGRWATLHLDLLLYGWCALPLVALLFRAALPERAGRAPRVALALWSGSLLAGAAFWLSGRSSGKLFLEWTGVPRWSFTVALSCLCLVLLHGLSQRRGEPRGYRILLGTLLGALLVVPVILHWAASPAVYPPYNPDSGGPTGLSLLGSSLGLVAIVLLVPPLAGMRRRAPCARAVAVGCLFGGHVAAYLLSSLRFDEVARSHHEPLQVAALSSLLIWWPALAFYLRGFSLPRVSRRWFASLAWWAALLLITAVAMFLPGVLERVKFGSVLVAHAHLAMAGAVSSLLMAVLALVLRETRLAPVLDLCRPWLLWNSGALLQILALVAIGTLEALLPGLLFTSDPVASALYALRALGGVAMLWAAWQWLRGAWCASIPERRGRTDA